MPRITELTSVQIPLVRHAAAAGWEIVPPEVSLGKRGGATGPFHQHELAAALLRLNPGVVTSDNVQSVIQELEALPSTIQGNREMLDWLRGARTIAVPHEKRRRNVAVIDYRDVDNNVFQVTYEWECTPRARKGNRADVVFLVNGIPIAIVENKNPKLPDAMERAIKQFRRYEIETPEMLLSPQVFNVTHLIDYLYGVTWNYARKNVFVWKEKRTESFQDAVQSFFRKQTLLRMLKDWILFYVKDDELQKTVLRQHQTRAAVKVVERCADPKKRRGLIWHTQGSGKTFTLITAARLILEDSARFPGATVLLVVDRNELEGQLSGWVSQLVGEMRGEGISIEYADSKARLQELFDSDFRGLIISMIHKFEGVRENSCTRDNLFVLIDEAHRSVGGPHLGNYLTGALPNATFIGFTGTPIDKTAQGRGTFKTFGKEDADGYLDKYSIKESIEDGTTVRLRHTLAPGEIRLPDEMLDQEFLQLAETEGVSDIEELNRVLDRAVRLKTFLKADDRVERVAEFIAGHFKGNVDPLGYKAFVVAVDREACAKYKEALDRHLPPEWSAPVYTKNTLDKIDRPLAAKHQLDDKREVEVRKAFAKPGELPKILIVTDKLLTGYDAPILYCMYLDKPMRDHVLLQAVARVNRPYEDDAGRKKECGIIIDFVGILRELNRAFSFDSADVSGVIEDLDVLFERFRDLIGQANGYLDAGSGTPDQQLERQLYGVYFDKDRRRQFFEYFKDLEALYEILSPDAQLREHISTYKLLADLYATLRNEYPATGGITSYELGRKTELLLVREAVATGDYAGGRTVEYDAKALDALRKNAKTDTGKVMNLLRDLRTRAETDLATTPALRGIFERAQQVSEQFQERQLSTEQALEQIQKLMGEQQKAHEERAKLGMDVPTFGVYWLLQEAKVPGAKEVTSEINGLFDRFPNYNRNADELRQLKAEIYKALLKEVSGKRMVELGDRIISSRIL